MAKMKTKKAAAKRMRVTRRGKAMIRHTRQKHLLYNKRRKRKRRLSRPGQLGGKDASRMRALVGK
ncbi:MAG: 50S ribosomal protein L35 [Armatimonadota bacterium]|jgi:large subunit ribosomal protein L35